MIAHGHALTISVTGAVAEHAGDHRRCHHLQRGPPDARRGGYGRHRPGHRQCRGPVRPGDHAADDAVVGEVDVIDSATNILTNLPALEHDRREVLRRNGVRRHGQCGDGGWPAEHSASSGRRPGDFRLRCADRRGHRRERAGRRHLPEQPDGATQPGFGRHRGRRAGAGEPDQPEQERLRACGVGHGDASDRQFRRLPGGGEGRPHRPRLPADHRRHRDDHGRYRVLAVLHREVQQEQPGQQRERADGAGHRGAYRQRLLPR